MPTQEQRTSIAECRKLSNMEVETKLNELKLKHKQEKREMLERQQKERDVVILNGRKMFVELKEKVYNTNQ